jgi:hypothetical protein
MGFLPSGMAHEQEDYQHCGRMKAPTSGHAARKKPSMTLDANRPRT